MGTFGKFDPDESVREGWARDQEDEVSFDGYNAFLQITTNDGSSGFSVTNSIGGVILRANSDGDGYIAKNLNAGVKISAPALQVSEGAVTSHVLTSDAQGNATWQPIDASGLAPGTLDGYHLDSTGQEHYNQHSQAINHILTSLDGYSAPGTDEKIKVSANDTAEGYLNGKLVTGTGVTLTEQNDGGNEKLEISITPGILDGYVEDGYHRMRDELVHVIAEDSYDEIIRGPAVGCFGRVTNITTWNDSSKTLKIREEQHTYSGFKVTKSVTIQYSGLGVAVETLTEDFMYSGNKITSITRTLT